MKVSFSSEELRTFRDCVERKVQDLKRSRESPIQAKRTCDSGSPVFLYREQACVCMELPK